MAILSGAVENGVPPETSRVEVRASKLGQVYCGPPVAPTIVVRPDISVEQANAERLSMAQTTELLVTDSLDLERAGVAGTNAIVSVAECAPSFRLAGRDLDSTCRTVQQLCEAVEPPGSVIDTEPATALESDRRSASAPGWLFPDRSAALHDHQSVYMP